MAEACGCVPEGICDRLRAAERDLARCREQIHVVHEPDGSMSFNVGAGLVTFRSQVHSKVTDLERKVAELKRLVWKVGHSYRDRWAIDWAPVLDIVEELDKADLEDRQELDVSPCLVCGKTTGCVPDGLPMCPACAEKQAKENGCG